MTGSSARRGAWTAIGLLCVWASIGAARSTALPAPTERRSEPSPTRIDPAAGRFLIATRALTGPFFERSIVLLLDYSLNGALGVIVNRPTGLALDALLPGIDQLGERSDKVFLGGPVETDMMVFLIRSPSRPPDSQPVIDDVHATGSAAALREVVKQNAPTSRFHAYVGYAGWGPRQLDREIERGDWYVAPADPDLIFDDDLPALWQKLVREHEGIQVRIGPVGGDTPIGLASR